jgi:hypothetical protein
LAGTVISIAELGIWSSKTRGACAKLIRLGWTYQPSHQ